MPCVRNTQTYKICRCEGKWRCQCMIPRERKSPPPFNTTQKQRVHTGMHPKFFVGSSDAPAVGSYTLPTKSKSNAIDWNKELKSKEFSATMGGRVVDSHSMQRNLMKTGRGPGTHDIVPWPDNILKRSCKTIQRDIGFGTVPRLKPARVSTVPGPGYTRKNPYYYIDKRKREGLSCIPPFEFDSLKPRFKRVTRAWSLPANLYRVKYSDTIEAFVTKVTGKRGPYDLFTGARDETSFTGYQTSIKLEDRGDWPKSFPGQFDKLFDRSNYFKGRFTTCPRFPKIGGTRLMLQDLALCYKDPKFPGPGHYDIKFPSKPKNAKNYPFNTNLEFARPTIIHDIRPGPGRYNVKDKHVIQGRGWTFVFKSKAPRTNFIIIPTHNAF